jgi:capsular exopolysaccharide synthesis family protein
VKPSLFAEQIAGDYQAIRTNLELYGNGIPRELAVTSACMQEAKTVFSTNLATSLAKSGRRVLLVDGDLRKPEVLAVLDASNLSQCRTDAVAEGRFAYTLWTVTSSGLDVLVPDFSRPGDAYELLASPVVAQRIELLGQRYDHIIIDTPPVLAFPDAIIWAKIAGRVVLSCFAGRTTSHELNEAKLRITQTNAVILGAVMSNVGGGHGYQRYGQNYYGKSQCATRITKRHKKKALLSTES